MTKIKNLKKKTKNFLTLKLSNAEDHHAQYEIRVYADIMLDTLKKWVPITYEAFMDYRVLELNYSKTHKR